MSNYGGLINVEELADKREYFSEDRGDVSFYCRDCKKIVDATRPNPEGYTFICPECEGEKVAIGTLEGLKSNYRIK